jgi:hypothetical protein
MDRHQELDLVFADTLMGNTGDGYVSFIREYGGEWFADLAGEDLEPGLKRLERWPFLTRLSRRNVMFLGSLLVRRESFRRSGGFDPALRGAADWEFFMRMTAGYSVAFSAGEPLALYEKHAEGMSTDSAHMETDFGLALEAVLKKCDLPSEVRSHVEQRVRDQWFGFAYAAYDAGDFQTARARLKHLQDLGLAGARERAYLALMTLPKGIARAVRRLKQRTA